MNAVMNAIPRLRPILQAAAAMLILGAGAAVAAELCSNTVTADVAALDQPITLNRFGASIPGGMIFALTRDVFPCSGGDESCAPLGLDQQTYAESCAEQSCQPGEVYLRTDQRPRPLVLRVARGDCLRIGFTNLLNESAECFDVNGEAMPCSGYCSTDSSKACKVAKQCPDGGSCGPQWQQPSTRAASIHVQGMPWVDPLADGSTTVCPDGTTEDPSCNDGSWVGDNTSSLVASGDTTAYTLYAEREGPFVLYSAGDDWQAPVAAGGTGGTLTEGLFGAVVVEPSGAAAAADETLARWRSEWYRSQVTEQDLCWASGDGADSGGVCTRQDPDRLPEIDYRALYPEGHPQAYLPILSLLCTEAAADQGVCEVGELVHTDLTALITGPDAGPFPDQAIPGTGVPAEPGLRPGYSYRDRLQPFRELTVMYHESFQTLQAFGYYYGSGTGAPSSNVGATNPTLAGGTYLGLGSIGAVSDSFGINYGFAGLGSPILANRFGLGPVAECADCKYEEFFLSSWTNGDPAMVVDQPTTDCVDVSTGQPDDSCPPPTRAVYPDDPTNVYHSYLRDHLKFRVLHGGSDLHHLHHQHAHQWLATPDSPRGDYLDSQSIGPGSAFTMEMVSGGSGNLNQTVGDSIFHCHFYPHFASGMWGLWRVHDVFEAGTELGECPDGTTGCPVPGARALPDGEIATGTPTPAVVPLPTLAMATLPAPVRLVAAADLGGRQRVEVQLVTEPGGDGPWVAATAAATPEPPAGKTWRNPGYPFYIPGVAGARAPHPPGDFAWVYSGCDEERFNGSVCSPARFGVADAEPRPEAPAGCVCDRPLDGGLPRSVMVAGEASFLDPSEAAIAQGCACPPVCDDSGAKGATPCCDAATCALQPFANSDFSKTLETATALELPQDGTGLEKIGMATHASRFHATCDPGGDCAPCLTSGDCETACGPVAGGLPGPGCRPYFILNGLPPVAGAPYADPCVAYRPQGGPAPGMLHNRYLAADLQIDAIFNKAGWHYPQQRILTLWGDAYDTLNRSKPPEPLFLRVNSYDCMEYVLANLVPNVYELDDFQVRTPTDILGQHIHLVKFDVTSSDGAANGWNYEDGTFAPNEVTERIAALNAGGGLTTYDGSKRLLQAEPIDFFGRGPGGAWVGAQATIQRWYDDPLLTDHGVCSSDPAVPCTSTDLSRCPGPDGEATCDPAGGRCSNDAGLPCTVADTTRCGDDKAICIPEQDRTLRTIFTHDHFSPSTHQQLGLYAGLVVEPRGSQWRDNQSGKVMGGFDPAIGENFFLGTRRATFGDREVEVKDGGPTSWQAVIEMPDGSPGRDELSFREFMLELQDSALFYKPFAVADGRGRCADDPSAPCEAGFGTCSDDPRQACLADGDCAAGSCEAPDLGRCSGDPARLCAADADCPGSACQPVGFCSYNGVCADSDTEGATVRCAVAPPGGWSPSSQCEGPCLLANDQLVACTSDSVAEVCARDLSARERKYLDGVQTCNYVTGLPSSSWDVTTPEKAIAFCCYPLNTFGYAIEAIIIEDAGQNFSFNYRNEPLFTRTADAFTGLPVPGDAGDLGFVYASLDDRPNSVGNVCSDDLGVHCGDSGGRCDFGSCELGDEATPLGQCGGNTQVTCSGDSCDFGSCESGTCQTPSVTGSTLSCRVDADCDLGTCQATCEGNSSLRCTKNADCELGVCEPGGFCSDNFALCTEADKSLCAHPQTASCDVGGSPYRPLTAGVGAADPFTPMLRAYAGDDVQIRTLVGAHVNPHNFTIHGLDWLQEPSFVDSGWRNSQVMGISEHFEILTRVPPSFDSGVGATDYLYQPGYAAIEQASGNWGLLRAYGGERDDLHPLPQNPAPETATPAAGVCPPDGRTVDYEVVALTAQQALGGSLVYNEALDIGLEDPGAILYFDRQDLDCPDGGLSQCTLPDDLQPEPLVLRAAAGDCVRVTLHNALAFDDFYLACSADGTSCDRYGALCPDSSDDDSDDDSGVCQYFQLRCSTDGTSCDSAGDSCDDGNGTCQVTGTCGGDPIFVEGGVNPVLNTACSPGGGDGCAKSGSPCYGVIGQRYQSGQLNDPQGEPIAALTSLEVGLRPQLLTYDARTSDGTNAGRNPVQTVAPEGEPRTYTWYAGHLDPGSDPAHVAIEFGASNLLPPDPLNHYLHGLFGGLIVEPPGVAGGGEVEVECRGPEGEWQTVTCEDCGWQPSSSSPTEAVVTYVDPADCVKKQYREFVVFLQDGQDLDMNGNLITAINYKSNLLSGLGSGKSFRQCDCESEDGCSSTDFSCVYSNEACDANGDLIPSETPTFQACAGEEVRFRLLHPGGAYSDQVFELYGHSFSAAPYMTRPEACPPSPELGDYAGLMQTNVRASQYIGSENLCGSREWLTDDPPRQGPLWDLPLGEYQGSRMGQGPGNHSDVVIGSAGGPAAVAGDYLYRTYSAVHVGRGMWGIFQVVDPDSGELTCLDPPVEAASGP